MLEVIFEGFWFILGGSLESKIDKKTIKNDVKNKNNFKTDVPERIGRCEGIQHLWAK